MQIEPVEQLDLHEEDKGSRKSTCQVEQHVSQSPAMIASIEDTVRDKPSTQRECYANTKVFNALKPLMFTCCAAGLLFGVDFRRKGIKKYFTLSHFYSFLIMIILAVNGVGYLLVFDSDVDLDMIFFMRLTMSIYNFECFAHFVCFYVASSTYNRLPKFFIQWEKVQSGYSFPLTSIKHQAYICTAILWIPIIIVTVGTTYFLFGTQMHSVVLGPLPVDHPQVNVIKAARVLVNIFQTAAWLAPSMFMFMVAKILSLEFTSITKHIGDADAAKINEILEPRRRHHQRLCNLVGHADDIFSMQIAVSLSGSFLTVCLYMYMIIYDQNSGLNRTIVRLLETYWIAAALARMLMDCISGAMLNVAVSLKYM